LWYSIAAMRVYAAVFILCAIAVLLTSEPSNPPPSWVTTLEKPDWWIPVLIALGTGLAIAYQAREMTRATKIATEQFEISQRPWVSVTRLPQLVQFNATGAILSCVYKLENVGGSVAWNISIWTDLVPEGKDWRPILDRLQGVMRDPKNQKSDYGYVLFPKESMKQHQPTILRRQDLDDAINKDVFKGTGKVGFKLVGCIDYRSHVSTKHYQTTFVDLVGYPDPRGTINGAFDPTRAMYGPVILTPHGHGAVAT
jgi:hypothetical protein